MGPFGNDSHIPQKEDPAVQVQRAILINLIGELERSLWWDRARLKASLLAQHVPLLDQVTGTQGDVAQEAKSLMQEIAGKERLLAAYREQLDKLTRH